jgi:beta-galactosidase
MKLGIAYYPEHEESTQWSTDYARLAEAGITTIRIAEFAWSTIEPEDGVYNWIWLDDAIDLAAQFGINVVLCTPTACPPIWLIELHPEILPVHKEGKTVGFGARQHRSYHSSKYVQYSLRIVKLMAQRYGDNTNVIAWQLDNEFGGETKYDFGGCAQQAFHTYLEIKYGTIEQLNRSWGTVFWSQSYHRFDQIPLPAPISSDVMMWHHPSLELEFARFSSAGIVSFARLQASVLREFIGTRPITTNAFMFSWGDNVNWCDLFAELDVVGIDIYSSTPYEIAFYCDASRSVLAKPFWIMEFGASSQELALKMDLIKERGCEGFYLFKMKPFPWGQEQSNGGSELMTLTGEPSVNYGVVQRYAQRQATELRELSEPSAKVGLYYHFDSSWCYQLSVGDRLNYTDYVVNTVYKSLYELQDGVIDILYSAKHITDQKMIVIPLHTIYDSKLEERLISYVQSGGRLVVTADLFRKNDLNVYLTEVPRLFRELFHWYENNFIKDAIHERSSTFLKQASGNGISWLLPRDASAEEWLEILQADLIS